MRRRKDAEGTGVLARLRHIAGPRKSMGAVFNNQLSCADGKEMWMDHSTEISDGLTSSYSVNHVNVHKPMDNDSRKGHIILDSDSSDINHESESVDNFSYTVLSGDSESTEDDVEDVSDIDEDFLPNDSSAHRFAAFSAPLNNSIIVSSSYRDEPALSHVVSVADLNRTPGATAIDFSKFVLGNPGGKPLNLKYEARKISRIKKKEKKVKPKKQAYRGPSFKRKK